MTRNTAQNARIPQIQADGRKFWLNSFPRPNPNYSNITQLRADSITNYNGLQATLQKALGSGLMFGASYTWSKTMSEADATYRALESIGGNASLDKDDPGADYSLSGYDQRHTVSVNSQYQMPWDRYLNSGVEKALLGGWIVKGIWQHGSGSPLNVQLGFNNSRSGNNVDRADLLPGFSVNPTSGVTAGCGNGLIPAGQKLKTADRWFDPCAFTLPPAGFLGNLGRQTVIGPGFSEVSFTLEKNTRITEATNLQFRAEVFNLLNHSNLGNTIIRIFNSQRAHNANEGLVTSMAGESRQIQLGLRLTF
jgi:hypothetical protein